LGCPAIRGVSHHQRGWRARVLDHLNQITVMLDPIERAEISAENAFFAMSQPDDKLKCGCGQVFDPDKEGGTVSPDPYAIPVCNRCLEEFESHVKINRFAKYPTL
jgi:hypothetical protein